DRSDIQATVDGKVTAGGHTSTGQTIDLSGVSTSNDTIALPNHGLHTGDVVVYSNGGGTSIGGLKDGSSYRVLVVDPNTVKLTNGVGIDLDNSGVNAGAQHGL